MKISLLFLLCAHLVTCTPNKCVVKGKPEEVITLVLDGTSAVIKGNRAWYYLDGKNYVIEFPNIDDPSETAVAHIKDTSSRATNVMSQRKKISEQKAKLEKATKTGNKASIEKWTQFVQNAEAKLYKIETTPPRGSVVIRLDTPHGKTNFDHININADVVNVGKAPEEAKFSDPHYKLPKGGIDTGLSIAKGLKVISKGTTKVFLPLGAAVDVGSVALAVANDVDKKTSRNTVTELSKLGGSSLGAAAFVKGGMILGSIWMPGLGTIIGGAVGGVVGSVVGLVTSNYAVNSIADRYDYNLEWKNCSCCGKLFKARVYLGEDMCEKCREN